MIKQIDENTAPKPVASNEQPKRRLVGRMRQDFRSSPREGQETVRPNLKVTQSEWMQK